MAGFPCVPVPLQQRPNLTVEVLPCTGSVSLFVIGPTNYSPPFPLTNPAQWIKGRTPWNSSLEFSPNSITFTLVAAQYFVTVKALENSTYSIRVKFDGTCGAATCLRGSVRCRRWLVEVSVVVCGAAPRALRVTCVLWCFGCAAAHCAVCTPWACGVRLTFVACVTP